MPMCRIRCGMPSLVRLDWPVCGCGEAAREAAALANPANEGKANRVLADELGVSEFTVRNAKAPNARNIAKDNKAKQSTVFDTHERLAEYAELSPARLASVR